MSENSAVTALDFSPASVKLGKSYLLVGTDAYLADRVLDKLNTKLKLDDAVDKTILYGDELKSAVLAEHLDAFSIFSSAKLIVIRNVEKMDKKELDTLGDYFDSPSEIQSLVIVTEKMDARFAAWKKIKASCLQITCEPPKYGGAIRAWLDIELKSIHKSMTPKAIEEFINRIELDFYHAANELNKIDLLSSGRTTITEKDVFKSLGTTRAGTLIDFYRALGKRQIKQSLEAMDKMLFADWEPLQVFFHFNKFYWIIWRILLLKKAHISENEILSKHLNDLFQNQKREYLDFSKSYSLASLDTIFGILLETDSQFKLSVAEANVLLCNCLIKLLEA
ncbi:MAG: DNA polymerase III subunit delta [Candidatus Cloacimonetes bacterium HGW-Cloacimonetes-3]|jgi:DNA polymerase III delta subunit|nr:MAG: DNA polymerase III subunit delta [Candidatus Cloacimonetes bacterium HGW-Cloacimonetes-3]